MAHGPSIVRHDTTRQQRPTDNLMRVGTRTTSTTTSTHCCLDTCCGGSVEVVQQAQPHAVTRSSTMW